MSLPIQLSTVAGIVRGRKVQYRLEVDGIRAIAVCAVIFYHAHLLGISGGFIGVDVFFVISGYLITSIISNDVSQGRFSLWNFYVRRALRILPALFVVLFATLPFAYLWLTPLAFKDFAQSLVGVLTFMSNVFFWLKTDYFDSDAALKPLLHTWSLAVEEQFYLVFPLAFVFLTKWGARFVLPVLVLVAILSFVLAVIGAPLWPAANFYLPFSRIWELLAGAVLAIYLGKSGLPEKSPMVEIASLAGLALVIAPLWIIDDTMPFPSYVTLAPILGTVLLIATAVPQTIVGRILSTRLMVGIGLISYSLYLWHMPVFAFSRIRLGQEPTTAVYLGLIMACIGLAFASMKLVETPIRRSTRTSRKPILLGLSFAAVLLGSIGAVGHITQGMPQRFPAALSNQLAEARYARRCLWQDGRVPSTLPDANCSYGDGPEVILLVGDSVAASLAPALADALDPAAYTLVQLTHGHCLPLQGLRRDHHGGLSCPQFLSSVIETANRTNPRGIILAGAWFQVGTPETAGVIDLASDAPLDAQNFAPRLSASFAAFAAELPREAVVIAPYIQPERDMSKEALLFYLNTQTPLQTLSVPREDVERARRTLLEIFNTNNLTVFDPGDVFCSDQACDLVRDGSLIFSDRTHFSPFGAALLADKLVGDVFR